jgi:hypothetical protein
MSEHPQLGQREVMAYEAAKKRLAEREARADQIRTAARLEYVDEVKRLGIAKVARHEGISYGAMEQRLRGKAGQRKTKA